MIYNKSVNITTIIRELTFYESGPSTAGSIYKTSFEVVTANDAALTPGKPYLSDQGALEWMVKEREVQLYQLQAAPPSTQPWEKVELDGQCVGCDGNWTDVAGNGYKSYTVIHTVYIGFCDQPPS